jgi:DtxR family transcriptional regulator, Mn-dependent transcriptional regulator
MYGQSVDEGGAEPLSASLEDYLEAILRLERASRVARVSEIAEQLGVSRPSVTGALKTLAARGLVAHAPYGHATLTQEGARIASEVEGRHLAIRDFLTGVLCIPEDRAEATACRMEHVLEPEILAYFVAYAGREQMARELAQGQQAADPSTWGDNPESSSPGRNGSGLEWGGV